MPRSENLLHRKDRQLWSQMKLGNRKAFSVLYRRYAQSLFIYGLRFTTNRTLIKDAIQEIFIEFWLKRRKLEVPRNVRIYVLTSLRYTLLKTTKAHGETKIISLNDFHGPEPSSENRLESIFSIQETNRLRICLNQLSIKQREIIHLKYFENLDNDEIAQVVEINYQSVSNLLHRAIKKLRKVWIKTSNSHAK